MVCLRESFAHVRERTRQAGSTLALAGLIVWLSGLSQSLGQESQTETSALAREQNDSIDFVRDILPIFEQHCFDCHGASLQESNLRLDVRDSALGTADFGKPVIVPGKSSESLLHQFVSGQGETQMPPEGSEPLAKEQIETLRRWIDEGAIWPDDVAGSAEVKLTSDHWSFQPVRNETAPELKAPENFPLLNTIDHFIAAKLAERGLTPSEPADAKTLIRRLMLDVHGLMPTSEQVQEFETDPSNGAYEKLVDEALASPRYGERWARHWLDVVRFGESTGFEVNRDRANAFYYRDYVIDSLNRDKPYRQFVLEQLAGDAMGVDEATGFLVGGPFDIVKSPDINLTLMQREDELADYVNTTSTAFLGLTVACARCHNHKFDPILQRDYYAIQAVFAGVTHGERPLLSRRDEKLKTDLEQARSNVRANDGKLEEFRKQARANIESARLLPMVNGRTNTESFDPVLARHVRFRIERTNQAEPCLDEFEIYGPDESGKDLDTNMALASTGATASSSGDYSGDPKHQLKHINDGVHGNNNSWIADKEQAWVQISLPEPRTINRIVWGRDRQEQFNDRLALRYAIDVSVDGQSWQEVSSSKRRALFQKNGKELDEELFQRLPAELIPVATKALSELESLRGHLKQIEQKIPVAYVGQFQAAKPIHRLHRGDPKSPREEVPPDTLTLLGNLNLTTATPEQERRKKLAEWMVADDNPLTARVIVNRVWHYHFGKGLVGTTSDFGKNGESPSHPELLDWLASEFVKNNWSLKWLHRQILMSSTYRQSSRPRNDAAAVDAESRLLWRFPPRRLEAEAIRDCVLQASGKLDLTMGGPGYLLFKIDRENVHHYFPLEKFEPQHFRRMIYMTKIRQEQDDVFGQFDCPDAGQVMPNRNQSTTPLQSLNLLNSPFVIEQSEFFATRLRDLEGDAMEAQIKSAYRILFSRNPDADELNNAVLFINAHGLPAFCRAMLNANEFLYLS